MRLRIGYHGRCFDGCTSAALFTRFYREHVNPDAQVSYRALAHQKGQVPGDADLDGDENAILDFKFSPSKRLTWWFDHHQSGFTAPEHRAQFDADTSGKKFFDPHCSSCTKLITSVVKEKFGFTFTGLEELIHWADLIDAARFDSAAMAVELKEPALQLMTVIEASDDAFCDALIPQLATDGLKVAQGAAFRARFDPMQEAHLQTVERIRQRAQRSGDVVTFDLSEWPMDGFNKFIGYYLQPDALYSVGVTVSPRRAKVSVGSNPWKQGQRKHDISALCGKYGGGGHPAVGAVTLPGGDVAEVKRIAQEITRALQG